MNSFFFSFVFYLFSHASFSAASTLVEESVHYTLAVGQGESSTTITTFSPTPTTTTTIKIAVTADIGSSSLKADPKYTSFYDMKNFTTIFEKKISPVLPSKAARSEDSEIVASSKPKKLGGTIPRGASPRGASMTNESTFSSSFDFLAAQLKDVKYWIVFLSHADEDHINYLKKVFDKIEAKEKTRVFLVFGGEWFNSNSTDAVRETFRFLYQNSKYVFPIYPYEDSKPATQKVKEHIVESDTISAQDKRTFNVREKIKGIYLDEFHGKFFDPSEKKGLTDLYQQEYSEFINNPSDKSFLEENFLQNIYIWSLDHRLGDLNAQSLVFSQTVRSIGFTFVHTGDAEHSTFEKIRSVLGDNPTTTIDNIFDNTLVILQAMHHGSGAKANLSSAALTLFRPHVCTFSAGTGTQHGHPSLDATDFYTNSLAPRGSEFWEKYHGTNHKDYHFYVFAKKQDGKSGKALAIKPEKNKPLLLGTNTFGTIKFSKLGIAIPMIHIPGYRPYYLMHAYECSKKDGNDLPPKIKVQDLVKMNNDENEEYENEDFWEDLENYTMTLSEDKKLYETDDKRYKLRIVEKKVPCSPNDWKYYFYVLKKEDSE